MLSDTGVMVFKGQSYTAEQMNNRAAALLEAAQHLVCNVDNLAGAEDLARALMAEASEWSDRARRCCDALTPAQRRTYENISEHLKRTGCGPTIVELAALENVTTPMVSPASFSVGREATAEVNGNSLHTPALTLGRKSKMPEHVVSVSGLNTPLPINTRPTSDLPVIGVAMIKNGIMVALPRPNRHADCIRYGQETLGLELPIGAAGADQGFYLADGTYLNRAEAFVHVKRIGQTCSPDAHIYLFSEDLW